MDALNHAAREGAASSFWVLLRANGCNPNDGHIYFLADASIGRFLEGVGVLRLHGSIIFTPSPGDDDFRGFVLNIVGESIRDIYVYDAADYLTADSHTVVQVKLLGSISLVE